jgi:hypothetical protein
VVLDKDAQDGGVARGGEEALAAACLTRFSSTWPTTLGQGLSVVLTVLFYHTTRRGQAVADKRGVRYHFVECICDDKVELSAVWQAGLA